MRQPRPAYEVTFNPTSHPGKVNVTFGEVIPLHHEPQIIISPRVLNLSIWHYTSRAGLLLLIRSTI